MPGPSYPTVQGLNSPDTNAADAISKDMLDPPFVLSEALLGRTRTHKNRVSSKLAGYSFVPWRLQYVDSCQSPLRSMSTVIEISNGKVGERGRRGPSEESGYGLR